MGNFGFGRYVLILRRRSVQHPLPRHVRTKNLVNMIAAEKAQIRGECKSWMHSGET